MFFIFAVAAGFRGSARPAPAAWSHIWLTRGLVRFVAIIIVAAALTACWRDKDVTEATNACAAKLYSAYDSKNFDQCVNACIKCDHGVMTTCSTSCRLKGAQ